MDHKFMFTLLFLSVCHVYAQAEPKTFTLTGKLIFPKNDVFTHLPTNSCIVVKVYQDILCSAYPCNIPVKGRIAVKVTNISKNVFNFEVECTHDSTRYGVSSQLHVGWCPTADYKGGYIRKGDYFNEFACTVTIPSNSTNGVTPDLSLAASGQHSICGLERCNKKNESCRVNEDNLAYCYSRPKTTVVATTPELISKTKTLSESSLTTKSMTTKSTRATFTLSRATSTLSRATSTLSRATSTLSRATSTLSRATSTLSRATSTLSRATSTLSRATSTLSRATSTLSRATSTLSRPTTTTDSENLPGVISQRVLWGSVTLPSNGVYTSFSSGSCLYITVTGNVDCMDDCSRPIVAAVRKKDFQIRQNKINYEIDIEDLNVGQLYSVSATLNVGWCNDAGNGKGMKANDYYSDTAYGVRIIKDFRKYILDIELVNLGKFQCGSKMCYKKEKCLNGSNGEPYCQCPPYACADVSEPEYVCGSDGKSYVTECWMKSADCFSGTITKVHDGKCGKSNQMSVTVIAALGIGGAILVLLMILLVMVCKCYMRYKKANSSNGALANPPSSLGSIKKKHIVDDFSVKEDEEDQKCENVYVDMPTHVRPPSYREKDHHYEEPPKYCEALDFENKTYNPDA